MLTIVTGSQNSGKTTALRRHFEKCQQGDGFIAVKHFEGSQIIGFSARRLTTGEMRHLAVHDCVNQNMLDVACKIGPYAFSQRTLNWIDKTILNLIAQKTQPLYLDEIGKLEMKGAGLNNAFQSILHSGLDAIISVRTDLLDAVLKHYDIHHFNHEPVKPWKG